MTDGPEDLRVGDGLRVRAHGTKYRVIAIAVEEDAHDVVAVVTAEADVPGGSSRVVAVGDEVLVPPHRLRVHVLKTREDAGRKGELVVGLKRDAN